MPKKAVKAGSAPLLPAIQPKHYIANLFAVLSKLPPSQLMFLYGDLLTENEADMLAKRLEIARGLLAGKSYVQIQKQLGVTANTVAQIQKVLKNAGAGFRSAAALLASPGESGPAVAAKKILPPAGSSPKPESAPKKKFFNSVFTKVFRSAV